MNTDNDNALINPFVPTADLPTGETVYAGRDRKSDPFRPMRYGNQKQAEAKLQAIRPALEAEGKAGAVVKQDGRFLILVYDAPEVFEIDPNKPLDVGSLPSWFASEAEKAASRNPAYDGPTGILTDYEGADSEQEPGKGIHISDVIPSLEACASKLLVQSPELSASDLDRDIHRETASEVLNVPESEVTDDQRRAAKTINYEEIYANRDAVEWPVRGWDMGTSDIPVSAIVNTKTGRIKLDKPNLRRRQLQGPGKIFATVSGSRTNPRNRHNQNF